MSMNQNTFSIPDCHLMDRKTKRIFLRMCRAYRCNGCSMPELSGGICGWRQMGNNWSPTKEELESIQAWGEAHKNDNIGARVYNHKINTALGRLRASTRNNSDYPGIDVRLERNGKSILLAWVEVDQSQQPPVLKMRLYGDCKDDEATDDRAISPGELDEYFASLADGARELV